MQAFSNNIRTELAAAITSSATTVVVMDTAGMPTLNAGDTFKITVENGNKTAVEIMVVTGVVGNTLTVVRGQEGTVASAFDALSVVEMRLTAGWVNQTEAKLSTIETGAQVNTVTPTNAVGLTNKTLDDISNNVGANRVHYKVKNMTGSTLANGTVVKVAGYEAGEETIRVAPTTSTGDVAIGIVHGSIAQGDVGLVVNTGVATGVNTTGYTTGSMLYQNGSGGLTHTKPTTGTYQAVAVPLNSKTDGALLVEFTEPNPVNWDGRYYTETEVNNLLSGKQATITGAATTITSSNLTASMALVSDASGKVAAHGTVSATELGYLDGVTSSVQTQLNSKEPTITTLPVSKGGTGVGTLTGLVKGNGTSAMTAAVAGTDYVIPSGSITGNAATATKLATARTINGVSFDGTANITISDATKAPLASPALTGTPTAPTAAVGTNDDQVATTAFVHANSVIITGDQTIAGVKTFSSSPIVPTATTATQAINSNSIFGFKNYIINGGFDVWQRGTSQTTGSYGSDDRWANNNAGSTKIHSQVACTDTERALFNAQAFSRTVVNSVAGAGNNTLKTQCIEDVTKLAGKTVTLSFWVKADSNKNIAVEFIQRFGTGGSPSAEVTGIGSQLVALTTAWQKKTVTVTLPSIVGKTLGTEGVHTTSTLVVFWLDAGSAYNSRTANLGQQSGTFDIAQVQLEEGSVATPFEQRPYGLELSLCQRYYEVVFLNRLTGTTYKFNGDTSSNPVAFATTKRVVPTINLPPTFISVIAVSNTGTGTGLSSAYQGFRATVHNVSVDSIGNSAFIGDVIGGGDVFVWGEQAVRTIEASAEL